MCPGLGGEEHWAYWLYPCFPFPLFWRVSLPLESISDSRLALFKPCSTPCFHRWSFRKCHWLLDALISLCTVLSCDSPQQTSGCFPCEMWKALAIWLSGYITCGNIPLNFFIRPKGKEKFII